LALGVCFGFVVGLRVIKRPGDRIARGFSERAKRSRASSSVIVSTAWCRRALIVMPSR